MTRYAEAVEGLELATVAHGVPFAVKDNMDVAGLPTTAGCPCDAFTPIGQRTVVARVARRRRDSDRQDESGPVRHGVCRPGSSTHVPDGVLRNPTIAICVRRIEFGLGGRGRPRAGAFSFGTDTAGSGRVPPRFPVWSE